MDAQHPPAGLRGGELERSLGLKEAIAIGVGTMVGAGIFIFPGLAGGRAGFSASLSYLIGAGIALIVALAISELATAMPRSGGGYYFVSRAMGPALGCIIGIGVWLGLILASAFYLSGFGHYVVSLLGNMGIQMGQPAIPAAIAVVVLVVIGVAGAEKTGGLQTFVVLTLAVLLLLFLSYAFVRVLGKGEELQPPGEFAPRGLLPIVTTAALVFTSYLGFAQVANVAGEIERPGRNLPLAMIGSVLVVGLLYVATMFVTTSSFTAEQLSEMGETAVIKVARQVMGDLGAVVLTFAGLLATISSANASIMGSSRTAFALGRDGLVPKSLGSIGRRFGTPHVSLGITGAAVVVLVVFGRLESLAQMASLLHLVMYGLASVSVILLRRRRPPWYDPSFSAPLHPVVPALGVCASFALIAFMSPKVIGYGVAIVAGAYAWHVFYRRKGK